MLKCNLDREKTIAEVHTSGSLEDITTELLMEIRILYHGMKKTSVLGALSFRAMLTESILDFDSPVWKNEVD